MAVAPARRRLGLGTDLLLVLLDAAANRGLHSIACTLETDTAPAQRLCRSIGLPPEIVRSPRGPDVVEIPVRRSLRIAAAPAEVEADYRHRSQPDAA